MGIGVAELLIIFVGIGVGVFGTALWIWMMIECATKEPKDSSDRLVWTIIIVFTHFIGAVIYLFARRPARIAETGA